jgi:hypothetical protein
MWITYSPEERGVTDAAFGAAFDAILLDDIFDDIFDAGFLADPGA